MFLTEEAKIAMLKKVATDKGFEFKEHHEGSNGYVGPAIVTPDVFGAASVGLFLAKYKIKIQYDDLGKKQKVVYF